jgi:MFS family permease
MAGCWLVSSLHLDASGQTFQLSAALWILVSVYTLFLPQGVVEGAVQRLTLRQRFGLDALALLKEHNHRVIFLTTAMVAIPFAAFYPYTPSHMKALGMERTSAWMSLGQVIEVLVMFAVGGLMVQWRLKPVILMGLIFGLVRYLLYSVDSPVSLLIGVTMHGLAYTFVYISTQIYLAQQVEPAWRTRAQALLSLMVGGVGNLIGYLVTGSWFHWCTRAGVVDWRTYWFGLAGLVTLVIGYFVVGYHVEGKRQE